MKSPADVAAHAQRLAREMLAWKAIELRVRQEVVGGTGRLVIIENYIETNKSQRFYDLYAKDSIADNTHETAWCDGKDCAYVACHPTKGEPVKQRNAIYSNIFMHEKEGGATSRPVPLKYFFVNRVPLYDALPKAESLGATVCLNRDCDAFIFHDLMFAYLNREVVYHLDKATSIPLRIELYDDRNALKAKRPNTVWDAQSLDEVQGFHMPLKSEAKVQIVTMEGKNKHTSNQINTFVVETLKYNADYPSSTFWPAKFDPGVDVIEGRTKPIKFYTIPGGEQASTVVSNPVQAAPPSNWTATASWIALLLGVAVLGAALWRWRKSKG